MEEIEVPEETILSQEPLVGQDGNALSIVGRVIKGLRDAGNSKEVIQSFTTQATNGDYDHLFRVAISFTE